MKKMILCWFCTSLSKLAQAEINLSVNNEQLSMNNGEYAITQDLGVTAGNNLFHSFHTFNIYQGESAAFSGAPHIENVISRVTGGSASNIDGTVKNTIPGADTYLINPAGIVFGENARLDVQGGFHATTSDYLEFSDGKFYADMEQASTFSVRSPQSFGFLSEQPATIELDDSRLTVPIEETLSLVGGDLDLHADTFGHTNLGAGQGQINLIASRQGSVDINAEHAEPAQGGVIELQNVELDVSGAGGGKIVVRGGELQVVQSRLNSDTLGNIPGRGIDIQVTGDINLYSPVYFFDILSSRTLSTRAGGDILIRAQNLYLQRSVINATGEQSATGKAADIDIQVEHLEVRGSGSIASPRHGTGENGQIHIKADSVLVEGGEFRKSEEGREVLKIASSISAMSPGGEQRTQEQPAILIEAEQLDLSNGGTLTTSSTPEGGEVADIKLQVGRLNMDKGTVSTFTAGSYDAGDIDIAADTISMTGGSIIFAGSTGSGAAGQITIEVERDLSMAGRRSEQILNLEGVIAEQFEFLEDLPSSIVNGSLNGLGGQIHIQADNIELADEAAITSASLGLGEARSDLFIKAERLSLRNGGQINNSNGGIAATVFILGKGSGSDIRIQADKLDIIGHTDASKPLTGIFTDTFNQGDGGNIRIQGKEVSLQGHAAITARSYHTGDAGYIDIQADTLSMQQQSEITTQAEQAGGGRINIDLNDLALLKQSRITTSVQDGVGNGGDLTITDPAALVLLDDAKVIAQAHEGQGGNIQIRTANLLQKPGGVISASSELGVDGEVQVSSSLEVGTSLVPVSQDFIGATPLAEDACAAPGKRSRIRWLNPDGRPLAAGDFQD